MQPVAPPDRSSAARPQSAVRMFGRFQLLRLLGKSERSMAWAVSDTRGGDELMLVLPRAHPDPGAAAAWREAVDRGARLSHPHLARVVEVGVHEGWPYVAYEAGDAATLADRLGRQGLPGPEMAALALQALQALAFAHDGGVVHGDIQPYMLFVSDQGVLQVAGLEVAGAAIGDAGRCVAPDALRAQRDAAQRDVLALGLVLHSGLCGQPALGEADIGRVIARMPPEGRDIVRLPWSTAHAISEPLRAIVNRATDRQERQRYRNARTLQRAIEGWLQAEAEGGGGPMALLQGKLHSAGVLPSSPGAAQRVARLAMMEGQRTIELAEIVLQDPALSFEMLRAVNSAQNSAEARGGQAAGSGPVLTVRRAIAMIGLDGVRRAALALRPWPGPLNDAGAAELEGLIQRVKKAGRLAVALRPAGWDAEIVFLVTLLQNLGRLVVQYHFPDEAAQIRRLQQPGPPAREGEPEDPGMSEEAAAFAVFGVDIEALGAAVARLIGLDESLLTTVRRLPTATAVRAGSDDADELRLVASCANEAVDALTLPAARVHPALQRVVQRYGRVLGLTLKELMQATQAAPASVSAATATAPLDGAAAPPGAAPGGLRAPAAARAMR